MPIFSRPESAAVVCAGDRKERVVKEQTCSGSEGEPAGRAECDVPGQMDR